MDQPLRVLIVEDSEDDTHLLLRELRRSGFAVKFERVETAEAMQLALTQKTWDLIMSDYTLPKFDAPQPSEALKNRGMVLLAEDNMANVLTVVEYLENHGYEVTAAHDGMEVLEKAEEIDPDLILMDIQMPVLDGLAAIRRLRKNPRFASTPVIALTALAMPGDRERCLESGANDYMSKPADLKMLLKTIGQLLR